MLSSWNISFFAHFGLNFLESLMNVVLVEIQHLPFIFALNMFIKETAVFIKMQYFVILWLHIATILLLIY